VIVFFPFYLISPWPPTEAAIQIQSPSPVLRSEGEAGWEKVADRPDEGDLTTSAYLALIVTWPIKIRSHWNGLARCEKMIPKPSAGSGRQFAIAGSAAFKFVRQLSVVPYIADFACRDHKLIVEVDGATHGTDAEVSNDERRSAYLHEQGYRILRFWNDDVFKGLPDVCDAILPALADRK
jgi:Protein of unknown function (DUF559)